MGEQALAISNAAPRVDLVDNPLFPVTLSNEALAWAVTQQTGQLIEPYEVSAFFEEIAPNLKLQSEVRYQALHYSGRMVDNWETAIDYQATEVSQSGVWGYTGAHDIMEYLHQALDGTTQGSGAYYRLRGLLETVIPWCMQHNIPVPDVVLAQENKSKLAQVGERAPAVIAAAKEDTMSESEAVTAISNMVMDAIDPNITVDAWKDRHPTPGQPRLRRSPAWAYLEPEGATYLVIKFSRPAEYEGVTKLLRNRIDVKSGHGTEPFLATIRDFLVKMLRRKQ